jgi:hypothetical protein
MRLLAIDPIPPSTTQSATDRLDVIEYSSVDYPVRVLGYPSVNGVIVCQYIIWIPYAII